VVWFSSREKSCQVLYGLQAQHRQVGRTEDSWEDKVYYYGNNIPKMTRNEILKHNKTDNVRINVARRRVRVTIIAVERTEYYML
jgi:hypothetical protein